MKNNKNASDRARSNNNNNNNDNSGSHNKDYNNSNSDKKKHGQSHQQHNQSSSHHHQRNPKSEQNYHQQHQQQQSHQRDRSGQRDRSNQRERSSQRNYQGTNQNNEVSMFKDSGMNTSNVGIRFVPGFPTRELPPIETKVDPSKKFTGRCRLFVGNLAHNTAEEKLRSLFERFGEVGEVFLGPKSAFAFVKMDTRQNAEAARDALDCTNYESRTLRVRLAAHAAAIRVKHLSPQVTNELLAYSFRYFGDIERAVVVVDDKGRSVGEGIVEYSKKHSAMYAIKRCQQECFILTATPRPVLVEPFDQQDEDEGLPEKSINKNSTEYKEQRDVGPRFADQGSFEHTFAMRWKDLYDIEKQKRDHLEQEIQEARKNLQSQIEFSRLEHDSIQLRNKLQELERLKMQSVKDQSHNQSQIEEQRRQQDMFIRQREEEVLRRQQVADPNGLLQQEAAARMQATTMHDSFRSQDPTQEPNSGQQTPQASGSQAGQDDDPSIIKVVQPTQARTFADAAMMALNPQQYIPVQQQQQQMGMQTHTQNHQMNPPNMFTPYIPPQMHQMQLQIDPNGNGSFATHQPMPAWQSMQQPAPNQGGFGRQQKFNRQYNNNSGNNNNTTQSNDGRPRKRGRY